MAEQLMLAKGIPKTLFSPDLHEAMAEQLIHGPFHEAMAEQIMLAKGIPKTLFSPDLLYSRPWQFLCQSKYSFSTLALSRGNG
uniref:Uncharacterized protein n=1 Tax=Globodera rostochiensis TaxID=31243 RepID=A0A914HFP8_GLORO